MSCRPVMDRSSHLVLAALSHFCLQIQLLQPLFSEVSVLQWLLAVSRVNVVADIHVGLVGWYPLLCKIDAAAQWELSSK